MQAKLEDSQIVAFESGGLRKLSGHDGSREAVLALPLSRLIVKMVKVPAETDAVTFATEILQGMSPFPDEPLTVSCEKVRDAEGGGAVVIAAALPESAADDIGEALDAEKLNVTRIDALVLGELRGVWDRLSVGIGRKLVLLKSADCVSMIVLDGDQPSAIRAITDESELKRETMLCLLEAEDFGGSRQVEEIVALEKPDATFSEQLEGLQAYAPIRRVTVDDPDAGLKGVADRSADPGALDALPESWREVLEETRFKSKMVRHLALALGIWALAMGVLFGVPIAYGFMTDYQKNLCKQHRKQYDAVVEMQRKTDIVKKYSDHSHGALEIMKAVSDRLPEGIVLSSWYYKRDEGVRVSGEADGDDAVYAFKDAMTEMAAGEGDDAPLVFPQVKLNGPSQTRNGYKFDLDCQYLAEEAE